MINIAFAGFVVGLLLHVVFKWASWNRSNPDKKGRAYFRVEVWENVTSVTSAIVLYGLWESGYLVGLADFLLTKAGHPLPSLTEIPVNFWTSVLAGYILDSGARHVFSFSERLLNRRPAPKS